MLTIVFFGEVPLGGGHGAVSDQEASEPAVLMSLAEATELSAAGLGTSEWTEEVQEQEGWFARL